MDASVFGLLAIARQCSWDDAFDQATGVWGTTTRDKQLPLGKASVGGCRASTAKRTPDRYLFSYVYLAELHFYCLSGISFCIIGNI